MHYNFFKKNAIKNEIFFGGGEEGDRERRDVKTDIMWILCKRIKQFYSFQVIKIKTIKIIVT